MRVRDLLLVRVGQIAIFTGPAVTLAITPNTNFDPINLAKLLILSVASLGFLGLFLFNSKFFIQRLGSTVFLLSLAFALWLILSLVFSDAHWEQQLWGVWGRSTGVLTYILLCLIMLAVASVQLIETYSRLVYGLIFVSILEIAYMAMQTFGKDPVGWSRKEAFGTLGNINFSSAFIGIAMVALFALLVFGQKSKVINLLIFGFLAFDFYVIAKTGSIQGPVIFLIGTLLIIGVKVWAFGSFWKVSYLSFLFVSFVLGVAGLLNKGPLASLLYQETLIFRRDYWFAGMKMTLENPIFGLGMDSYGDYYRELRGLEATVRTGPDRISNSAHNIYLDVSSGGGIPLLLLYVLLLGMGLIGAIRYLRSSNEKSWHFIAVAGAWVAYQIQALVSINQIGVGVWGWILTGCLIGYGRIDRESLNQKQIKKPKIKGEAKSVVAADKSFSYGSTRGEHLPAPSLLALFMGMTIGFLVALPPMLADRNFKTAIQTRQIEEMESALQATGITAFHFEHVIQSAALANLPDNARNLAHKLLETYPRNYYAWGIIYQLAQSDQERNRALQERRRLDPFNPGP